MSGNSAGDENFLDRFDRRLAAGIELPESDDDLWDEYDAWSLDDLDLDLDDEPAPEPGDFWMEPDDDEVNL